MKSKRLLLSLALLAALLTGCANVEPGWVAIKVNNFGSQKGVSDYPLYVGMTSYNPFTEDIYKFPVFQQLYTWTKDPKEGAAHDESFTVNTVDAVVNFDASISYQFVRDQVPHIFVELRKDPDGIMHGYMKQQVRDALNKACNHRKVMEVYGSGRTEMLLEAKTFLEAKLAGKFTIDTLTIVGNMRIDPHVQDAINAVIGATQKAAEAQAKIAEADAQAHQAMKTAEGEAQAILTVAEAQAKANRELAASITPAILEKMKIEKWNGALPTVQGGGTPLISIKGN